MTRTPAKLAIDLALWTLATPLAFALRLEEGVGQFLGAMVLLLALGFPLKAFAVLGLGLHRRSWHRLALYDLLYLAVGVGAVTLVLAVGSALVPGLGIPRSVPLIEGMIALMLMGTARVATRVAYERQGLRSVRRRESQVRVLIVGAGEAGDRLARELQRTPESGRVAVGFLDDDPAKARLRYGGLPVLGAIDDLVRVADANEIGEVLLAIPSAGGAVVRRVLKLAREARVEHRTVPGLGDILRGAVSISQTQPVALEDLLRREAVQLDVERVQASLSGKRVLVTGAGGSIGSEIVRQVAMFGPAEIVLLGRGENSIYTIHHEMRRRWRDVSSELYRR